MPLADWFPSAGGVTLADLGKIDQCQNHSKDSKASTSCIICGAFCTFFPVVPNSGWCQLIDWQFPHGLIISKELSDHVPENLPLSSCNNIFTFSHISRFPYGETMLFGQIRWHVFTQDLNFCVTVSILHNTTGCCFSLVWITGSWQHFYLYLSNITTKIGSCTV